MTTIEVLRIHMLPLRVAVLLVLRSSNGGGLSTARMIVKETMAKEMEDRPDTYRVEPLGVGRR
jgi:hypothetical protein